MKIHSEDHNINLFGDNYKIDFNIYYNEDKYPYSMTLIEKDLIDGDIIRLFQTITKSLVTCFREIDNRINKLKQGRKN